MITLHKPERATYDQPVEAQREFNKVEIIENPPGLHCTGVGSKVCCC